MGHSCLKTQDQIPMWTTKHVITTILSGVLLLLKDLSESTSLPSNVTRLFSVQGDGNKLFLLDARHKEIKDLRYPPPGVMPPVTEATRNSCYKTSKYLFPQCWQSLTIASPSPHTRRVYIPRNWLVTMRTFLIRWPTFVHVTNRSRM